MNTGPKPEDDSLRKCLREWRVEASPPPRFQEQVWRRIQDAESGRPAGLGLVLQNLAARFLGRRGWVPSYLSLALAVGLGLGYWQAKAQASSVSEDLRQQYVQSIDPYQRPR